jgi:hypothetical protein
VRATVRLVMLTALRDRLFVALFGLLALTTALSVFLGGAAINEQLEMSVVFAAGAGRIVLILGLSIFAAFHIQALFETREVEAILSRALSRAEFVFAYWLGLALVALLPAAVFGAAVAFVSGMTQGVLLWGMALALECVIVLGVVLFAGLMLQRATTTVLFTMGFYALARLMGFFLGIRAVADDTPLNAVVNRGLSFVLVFIPRLDLFTQSRWLVYGASFAEMQFVALQSILFLALVLLAAMFDLSRKQF